MLLYSYFVSPAFYLFGQLGFSVSEFDNVGGDGGDDGDGDGGELILGFGGRF